jgi:two-component system, NtrC family, nitrogen regulation response regulator GlnG
MPMEAQTRLLRVLQQGEYTTVGGRTPIKANVRIVAATNKDLRQAIQQGLFREDLYLPPQRRAAPPAAAARAQRGHSRPRAHFFTLVEKEGCPASRSTPPRWSGCALSLARQCARTREPVRRLAALYPQETISEHLSLFQGVRRRLPPPGLYHRILREIEQPLLGAALAATAATRSVRRNCSA